MPRPEEYPTNNTSSDAYLPYRELDVQLGGLDYVVSAPAPEPLVGTEPDMTPVKKLPASEPESFGKAFNAARDQGLSGFTWKGKRYTTELAGEKPATASAKAPAARAPAFPDTNLPGLESLGKSFADGADGGTTGLTGKTFEQGSEPLTRTTPDVKASPMLPKRGLGAQIREAEQNRSREQMTQPGIKKGYTPGEAAGDFYKSARQTGTDVLGGTARAVSGGALPLVSDLVEGAGRFFDWGAGKAKSLVTGEGLTDEERIVGPDSVFNDPAHKYAISKLRKDAQGTDVGQFAKGFADEADRQSMALIESMSGTAKRSKSDIGAAKGFVDTMGALWTPEAAPHLLGMLTAYVSGGYLAARVGSPSAASVAAARADAVKGVLASRAKDIEYILTRVEPSARAGYMKNITLEAATAASRAGEAVISRGIAGGAANAALAESAMSGAATGAATRRQILDPNYRITDPEYQAILAEVGNEVVAREMYADRVAGVAGGVSAAGTLTGSALTPGAQRGLAALGTAKSPSALRQAGHETLQEAAQLGEAAAAERTGEQTGNPQPFDPGSHLAQATLGAIAGGAPVLAHSAEAAIPGLRSTPADERARILSRALEQPLVPDPTLTPIGRRGPGLADYQATRALIPHVGPAASTPPGTTSAAAPTSPAEEDLVQALRTAASTLPPDTRGGNMQLPNDPVPSNPAEDDLTAALRAAEGIPPGDTRGALPSGLGAAGLSAPPRGTGPQLTGSPAELPSQVPGAAQGATPDTPNPAGRGNPFDKIGISLEAAPWLPSQDLAAALGSLSQEEITQALSMLDPEHAAEVAQLLPSNPTAQAITPRNVRGGQDTTFADQLLAAGPSLPVLLEGTPPRAIAQAISARPELAEPVKQALSATDWEAVDGILRSTSAVPGASGPVVGGQPAGGVANAPAGGSIGAVPSAAAGQLETSPGTSAALPGPYTGEEAVVEAAVEDQAPGAPDDAPGAPDDGVDYSGYGNLTVTTSNTGGGNTVVVNTSNSNTESRTTPDKIPELWTPEPKSVTSVKSLEALLRGHTPTTPAEAELHKELTTLLAQAQTDPTVALPAARDAIRDFNAIVPEGDTYAQRDIAVLQRVQRAVQARYPGAQLQLVDPKTLSSGDPLQAAKSGAVSQETAGLISLVTKAISGRKAIFFKSSVPTLDGAFLPGSPKYVFVNTRDVTINPLRATMHEVLHGIRFDDENIYRDLRNVVMSELVGGDRALAGTYAEHFGGDRAIDGIVADLDKPLAHNQERTLRDFLEEELVADLFGNRMTESAHWRRVFNKLGSNSAVRRLAAAINKAIARAQAALGGKPFEADKLVRDLDRVREAVATAQAKHMRSGKHGNALSREAAAMRASERRKNFADPEDRIEVSTAVPSTVGRENAAYTENLVIDAKDVLTAREYATKLAKAVSQYNTMLVAEGAPTDEVIQALHDLVVDNLLWLHNLVPEHIRKRAKLWYDGANRIAKDLSKQFGLDVRQTSAVLAIFSPQKDWFQNVSLAERAIRIMHDRAGEQWTPAMTEWFESWVGASADVGTKRDRAAYLAHARTLEGKRLSDMDDADAAMFVRTFDETYHPREYRLVTPEGGFGDFVTGDTGEASVGWPGFGTIEKAVNVLRSGKMSVINSALGNEHKVRNFYNNIVNPNSAEGHVTIDTHAIGAALFKAMSGESLEVKHNFGGTNKGYAGAGKSGDTGASGTYAIFADAYRAAAEQVGLLPREMQSITWEAIRALFPAEGKKSLTPKVEAIWDRYKAGKISRTEARSRVYELTGGKLPTLAWEGTPVGMFAADGGTSFDGALDADPAKRKARKLAKVFAKDKITVTLSAYTRGIKAMASLKARAQKGDHAAHMLLQDVALSGLKQLLKGLRTKIATDRVTGLYGGSSEPSLALTVTFRDEERGQVLAALNRFAETFKQEQVHVRKATKAKLGHVYQDGSYVTPVYRWELDKSLTAKQVQTIISSSGLYGLTFGDDFIEAYYVGDTHDTAAVDRFTAGIKRAGELITFAVGESGVRAGRTLQHLWAYGRGDGGIGWPGVHGDVSAQPGVRAGAVQQAKAYLDGDIRLSPARPDASGSGRDRGVAPQAEPRPSYGTARQGSVRATGVHYSTQPQTDLNGAFYGRGLEGAERVRIMSAKDRRLRERIYFYVSSGAGVTPEFGVGGYAHSVDLNNLYDGENDPLNLHAARDGSANPDNAFESAVIDAGFDGFVVPFGNNQKAAVLLGRHNVRVRQEPTGYRGTDTAPAESATPNQFKKLSNLIAKPWRSRTAAEWALFVEGKDPELFRALGGRSAFTGEGYLWPDQIAAAVRNNAPEPILASAPRFTSPLATAVAGARQEAMPAAQWKLWLASNKSKLGLKDDEITFSGINDYLDLRGKDKVTKADVADYLSGNGVKVNEVVKGGRVPRTSLRNMDPATSEAIKAIIKRNDYLGFDTATQAMRAYAEAPGNYDMPAEDHAEMRRLLNLGEADGATKFSGYWDSSYKGGIPGTYRETLVTLPVDSGKALRKVRERITARLGRDDWQWPDLTEQETDDLNAAFAEQDRGAAGFRSGHWDEPNVLVHIRTDEVMGADGKRYLRVGEVQSDWGQEGKKKGFGTQVTGETIQGPMVPGAPTGPAPVVRVGVPEAPFVTDTKAWVALGIKQAIRQAIESGADGIVFGTGQQNADLYDLSKQVDRVSLQRMGRNRYLLIATDHNGNDVVGQSLAKPEEAEDYVGKEVAARLIADMGSGTRGEASGDGLKVGGEGMRAFYDKIVPQVANDVLRKLGGGKVGIVGIRDGSPGQTPSGPARYRVMADGREWNATTTLGSAEIEAEDARAKGKKRVEIVDTQTNVVPQPGFLIPDAMREKIDTDGIALFSARRLADEIKAMTPDQRDNLDVYEFGYRGYVLYEAEAMMPKKVNTMKAVTANNSFTLWQEADAVANIDGKAWLATKQEDPDDDNDEGLMVWAFSSPDDADKREYTTAFADKADAIEDFRARLASEPVLLSNRRHETNARAARGPMPPSYDIPDGNAWRTFVYNFQDRFDSLKQAEKAPHVGDAKPYRAESLYHGMSTALVEDFDADHVKPLLAAINDAKLSLDDVGRYLLARHAPEANRRLKAINPTRQNNDALSGMTDARAAQTIAEFTAAGKLPELDAIAARTDAINKMRRDLLISADLEDAGIVQAWENTYQFYAPLFREDMDTKLPVRGKGFDTRGKSKRRAGSERAVDTENMVARIVAAHEATIVRSEKARVAREMLKFVQDNPAPHLWEVNPVDYAPRFDANGLVTYARDPSYALADNVLEVRQGGQVYHISFNTENEHSMRIVTGLKNLNASSGSAIIRALGQYNRYLSTINTSLNPEFTVVNFLRDIQTAGYNLTATEANGLQLKIMRDVGKAFRGIISAEMGGGTHPWSRHYRRFRDAGAKTGWLQSYGDITERGANLQNELWRMQSGAPQAVVNGVLGVVDFVEKANVAIENAVRLSAFVHAREMFMSQGFSAEEATAKAGSLAKEMTVNFNRRGEQGTWLNALYLFANAAIQGSATILLTLSRSRTAQLLAAATVAAGFGLELLARALSDTDDDDELFYDKLPNHIKDRNIILMLPNTGGDYAKVPLPWGYNVFHVLGQEIAKSSMVPGYDKLAGAARFGAAVFDAYMPIGFGGSGLQWVSPTVLDPLAMLSENKSGFGTPLYPEDKFSKYPGPLADQHFKNARPASVWLADKLNRAAGGDEFESSVLDTWPATFDLLWDTGTGGLGRFMADTASLPFRAADGTLEARSVPFLRKVYGEPDSKRGMMTYMENRLKLAKVKDILANGTPEQQAAARKKYPAEAQVVESGDFDFAEKHLGKVRKWHKQAETEPDTPARAAELKKYKEEERQTQVALNKALNHARKLNE